MGVTGATVTVACKIPQGMLIQLHEKQEFDEVVQGGNRKNTRFVPTGEPIHIKGPAHPQNEGPRVRIVGGYALTERVPKDIWDRWVDQSGKHLPAMKNRLLYAYDTTAKTADAAREAKKQTTGLERLDPNNLPVQDKRFKLKTADEATAIPDGPTSIADVAEADEEASRRIDEDDF